MSMSIASGLRALEGPKAAAVLLLLARPGAQRLVADGRA
jgi:hypothetical protein